MCDTFFVFPSRFFHGIILEGFVFLSWVCKQVVLSCIDGSPAARAGIHEGDELVEIDGRLEKMLKTRKFLGFQ